MPTRLFLLFIACLTLGQVFSQNSRSSVTFSGGIERTLYWDMRCPHIDLGYNYALGEYFNINAGIGFTRKSPKDIPGFAVKETLQNIEPNAHLLYSILGNSSRYNLKIGAGIRQIFTSVDYTPFVKLENHQVVSVVREKYKVNKPALDIVVQSDYRIYKKLFIGLHLGCNIYKDKNTIQPIRIEATEDQGFFKETTVITSYPLSVLHGLIRIGYYL